MKTAETAVTVEMVVTVVKQQKDSREIAISIESQQSLATAG